MHATTSAPTMDTTATTRAFDRVAAASPTRSVTAHSTQQCGTLRVGYDTGGDGSTTDATAEWQLYGVLAGLGLLALVIAR